MVDASLIERSIPGQPAICASRDSHETRECGHSDLYIAVQQCVPHCAAISDIGRAFRSPLPEIGHRHAQRKIRRRHRLHLRHRARHRARLRQGGRQPHHQRLRRQGRDREGARRHREGVRRQGDLFAGRHDQAGRDRRHDRRRPRRPSAASTCWSTMPASSSSRRSRISRSRSGTRSSRSICRPRSTPCRAAMPGMKARKWGRIINIASAHSLVASPFKVGLRRGQARHRRPHQDGRARGRDRRHHLQLHLPRLGADAAGREADPDTHEGAQHDRRAGQERRARSRRSRPSNSSPSSRSARSRCFSARDAAAPITGANLLDRRRLDRAVRASLARRCHAPRGWRDSAPRQGQEDQSRAAGRRRARRVHLGRARPPARATSGSTIEGISGTSAGAINAVMLADGLARGGPRGGAQAARRFLARGEPRRQPAGAAARAWSTGCSRSRRSKARRCRPGSTRCRAIMSPYDLNPLNINPLRDLIERFVDFDAVRACTRSAALHLGDQRADRPRCASFRTTRSPPTR